MKRVILLILCVFLASGCATVSAPYRNFQASVPTYNMNKYPLNVVMRITREDADMQSSDSMMFILPAPVIGGKVQTYVGRYFGKMLFQGAGSMFRNTSEYIGPLQFPNKMQALLGAAKDRSASLIILGMPRDIRISDIKNMDNALGATLGMGKNEPWSMTLTIKTEMVALNSDGKAIYKGEYSNSETSEWSQWRAFGNADITELFNAVHGLYDNIFEKQVSKFLFELSENSNFKQMLQASGAEKKDTAAQSLENMRKDEQAKSDSTAFNLTGIDVYLDSEPQGAEIYFSYSPRKSGWLRLLQKDIDPGLLSSDVTPMTYKIAKSPGIAASDGGFQARKQGYYDSEIITFQRLYHKHRYTFILKKK